MLFRKKHPRSCLYCRHCTKLDDTRILCIRRGIVTLSDSCRKFSYDPFKRIPPKPKAPEFTTYNEEDFSL